MTNLRQAAQQALEALEFIPESGSMLGAQAEAQRLASITTLRAALAEPEHHDPIGDAQDKLIAEQVASHDYRTRYDRGCYKCGSHYCPADCLMPTHLVPQQPQMQPCAGRNCGSTNPNLHSAECFEDYEKSTGVVGQDCDCPYLNIHDAVVKDNDKALSLLSQCLDEMQYAGWNKPCADQKGRWNVFSAVLNYLHPSIESDT